MIAILYLSVNVVDDYDDEYDDEYDDDDDDDDDDDRHHHHHHHNHHHHHHHHNDVFGSIDLCYMLSFQKSSPTFMLQSYTTIYNYTIIVNFPCLYSSYHSDFAVKTILTYSSGPITFIDCCSLGPQQLLGSTVYTCPFTLTTHLACFSLTATFPLLA